MVGIIHQEEIANDPNANGVASECARGDRTLWRPTPLIPRERQVNIGTTPAGFIIPHQGLVGIIS